MNRQDLIDYKYNKSWIDDRISDIEQRKELLNRLTAIYGEQPRGTSPIQDKVADDLAQLLDETEEYLKLLNDLKKKQFEIEDSLDRLPPFYRNILYKVYIKGKKLVTVADEINYSYEETCRKHGAALNMYDNLQ